MQLYFLYHLLLFSFFFLVGKEGSESCTVTPKHHVWDSKQGSPVGSKALLSGMPCVLPTKHPPTPVVAATLR